MRWFASLLLAGLATPAFACGDSGAQMASEQATDLKVFAALEPVTVSKPFALNLTLCGNNAKLSVKADAWMPRHKHGMNYAPVVTNKGEGKYAVSNMVFHMPGLWQVRVNVRDPENDRPTTYLLDVQVK